jgi:hypothetical protein
MLLCVNCILKYVTSYELHPTELLSVQTLTENKKQKCEVTVHAPIVIQLDNTTAVIYFVIAFKSELVEGQKKGLLCINSC